VVEGILLKTIADQGGSATYKVLLATEKSSHCPLDSKDDPND